MKDIVWTAKQQRNELLWLGACIAAAFLMNIVAILCYGTQWSELWTQLLWVLTIGVFFYIVSVIGRLVVYGVKRLLDFRRHPS